MQTRKSRNSSSSCCSSGSYCGPCRTDVCASGLSQDPIKAKNMEIIECCMVDDRKLNKQGRL